MVRQFLFLIACLGPVTTFAQRLQVGLKADIGLSTKLETSSRKYYFPFVDNTYVQVGAIDATTEPAVEFFVRYDHYDRHFFQYGINGSISDYTISVSSLDTSDDPYEIQSINLQQYIAAGRILSTRSNLKPYASIGIITNFFLGYSNAHAYENGTVTWAMDESIVHDLEQSLKPFYLMGRMALGAKFYALHTELVLARNITPLDTSSENQYYKSLWQLQFSVGYNFLSFNTVKKKSK